MGDPHLTYPEAIVVGLLQGVTELFPVSSLGHSVLIPALIGGRWAHDLNLTADKSPYLTFLVAVHVATAVALVVFFRRDWIRITVGLYTSLRDRKISNPDQRLAWLLIIATIPVGLTGLALEHALRSSLGNPSPPRSSSSSTAPSWPPWNDSAEAPTPAQQAEARYPSGPFPAKATAGRCTPPPATAAQTPTLNGACRPATATTRPPRSPPTTASPPRAGRRRCSSAPPRSSPYSPGSAAPAPP
jgi:hypothetical protein